MLLYQSYPTVSLGVDGFGNWIFISFQDVLFSCEYSADLVLGHM